MGRQLLYEKAAGGLGQVAPKDHGLRFAKFFGAWIAAEGGSPQKPFQLDKSALLDWMAGAQAPNRQKGKPVSLTIGDAKRLSEASARLEKLAHRTLDVGLVSRLFTGLGLPHPTENGFLFHPTLAVPYLRGTGLKQVARRAAEDQGVEVATLNRIFGALGPDGSDEPATGGVGSVCFLDGLPTTPVTLAAEQITPHYTGYYQGSNPALGGAREPMESPADWYEPIPITLLAVEASWDRPQPFRLGLCGPQQDVEQALGWLEAGLADVGFGARTTLGFGRCLSLKAIEAMKAEQDAIQAKSAAQAEADLQVHGPPVGTRIFWFGMDYEVIGRTDGGDLEIRSLDDDQIAIEPWDPANMRLQ